MTGLANETFLSLGLLGVAIYFSVLVVKGLARLWLFRKLRSTAVTTWPSRAPAGYRFLVGLGCFSAGLAVVTALRERPPHHVYSQAVMALYFMLMMPLAMRIRRGLYEDGVWADTGFLPYRKIGRLAFRETPEIVLVLVPRGRSTGSFRLRVPPGEYGTVRKVLEEKIRARVLVPEKAILGLSSS